MTRTAICCCGAASFTLEGEPVFTAVCHCDDCKKRTGSAFGWVAYFMDAAVTARTGELSAYVLAPEKATTRWFCARCGSTLAWAAGVFPGMTGIAAGNLTGDPLPTPAQSVWHGRSLPWLALDPAIHASG